MVCCDVLPDNGRTDRTRSSDPGASGLVPRTRARPPPLPLGVPGNRGHHHQRVPHPGAPGRRPYRDGPRHARLRDGVPANPNPFSQAQPPPQPSASDLQSPHTPSVLNTPPPKPPPPKPPNPSTPNPPKSPIPQTPLTPSPSSPTPFEFPPPKNEAWDTTDIKFEIEVLSQCQQVAGKEVISTTHLHGLNFHNICRHRHWQHSQLFDFPNHLPPSEPNTPPLQS